MNNQPFNTLHHLIGSLEFISREIVKKNYKEYIEIITNFNRIIYCSEYCAKKSCNYNVIELHPSNLNFPINNLVLKCIVCGKIIKYPESFYTNDKDNSQKFSLNSFLYETTFCNFFLKFLVLFYIKKYYNEGFNFKLDSFCNYTSNWLIIVLNGMQSNIDKNISFFRVQKDLHPLDGNKDLTNKNLMLFSNMKYLKDNRLTKAGIFNLYLSEDIETGKKEIRYEDGEYYYAEFITKKRISTIDFTLLKEKNDFSKLTEKIYSEYSERYGNNYHVYIIIKSAVECFNDFLIPMLTKRVNDNEPFKPEYVINQFISDISKATYVDSICYNSTRNENKRCLCFFRVGEINNFFNQRNTIKVNS